jgi:hypothetical protein
VAGESGMTIANPADLIPIIGIITALLAGIGWIVKSQLAMQRAFQPNGGTSVKDQLNRIEADVREVRTKVDDHITWHLSD